MNQSGELRDINRHYYSLEEIDTAVQQPVVQRLLKLMRFRCSYPAFEGRFELNYSNDSSVSMAWRHGDYYCSVFVDLNFNKTTVNYLDIVDLSEKTLDVN